MLNARDWTLLVIASAQNGHVKPVQLQKSLFLLGRNLSAAQLMVATFYDFTPYDYGPFSSEAYVDAEELEREGLVTIDRPPLTRYKEYSVTEAGRGKAQVIRENLAPSTVEYLDRVVAWARSNSFSSVVTAIYKAYPEMKANSVFQD